MSWLRIDDGEVLDARVGSLTDTEYRSRHALMQLCARERELRDTGIFHDTDIVLAVYATPKGPRSVTRKTLARLHELELVGTRNDYDDAELIGLGIAWPDGDGWYRISTWEKYNPPRDNTAAERQKRRRSRKRHAVTPPDVTGASRRDKPVDNPDVTVDVTRDVTDVSRPLARAPARASSVPSRKEPLDLPSSETRAVALEQTNGPGFQIPTDLLKDME